MKKLLTLLTVVTISFTSLQTQAQAFDKSSILLNLGIGPGEMIHFATGQYSNGYYQIPTTGQLSFQAEFAVHKYVGVGFVVGIGGRAQGTANLNGYGFAKEVNVPIGLLANFHFFQLIADKRGLALGNKLDVYAGITAGSGAAIYPYKNQGGSNYTAALFYFGPHAGVNYYFTKNIAVNGEVGWGVTVIQAGITFNVGGKGK
jgi:hypothetical protein